MKIIVQHREFDEITGNPLGFTDVAEVAAEGFTDVDEALEYAYRWTNNVMGSWSRDDIEDNSDYNPNVTRLAPLVERNGRIFGLRSSMMGDQMIVDGTTYKVAAFGFQAV